MCNSSNTRTGLITRKFRSIQCWSISRLVQSARTTWRYHLYFIPQKMKASALRILVLSLGIMAICQAQNNFPNQQFGQPMNNPQFGSGFQNGMMGQVPGAFPNTFGNNGLPGSPGAINSAINNPFVQQQGQNFVNGLQNGFGLNNRFGTFQSGRVTVPITAPGSFNGGPQFLGGSSFNSGLSVPGGQFGQPFMGPAPVNGMAGGSFMGGQQFGRQMGRFGANVPGGFPGAFPGAPQPGFGK